MLAGPLIFLFFFPLMKYVIHKKETFYMISVKSEKSKEMKGIKKYILPFHLPNVVCCITSPIGLFLKEVDNTHS